MNRHLTALVVLILSCAKPAKLPPDAPLNKNDSSELVSIGGELDSLTLRKLILANDQLLGIPKIQSEDPMSVKIKREMQKPSYRVGTYNLYEFKITSINICKEYRHILLSKSSRDNSQPFTALYLLILNSDGKLIAVERLEAVDNVPTANWKLEQDSTLIIDAKSKWCSDVVTEDEEGNITAYCWTETIHKVYHLNCDGLILMKRDSARTGSEETEDL